MLNSIFDPIFGPLLNLYPILTILILSFFISLLVTLVYKFLTDQNLMKDLKNEITELQKELKSLRNNPKKAMKVQSQMMETNSRFMMHSMKPTLFTFVPIILIFSWFNTHLGYYPLLPNQPFDVIVIFDKEATGTATLEAPSGLIVINEKNKEILGEKLVWTLKGEKGDYVFSIINKDEKFEKRILITETREYVNPDQKYKGAVREIIVGNKRVYPFGDFSLVGWRPGWLAVYIMSSLVFSMSLRKLLKVY